MPQTNPQIDQIIKRLDTLEKQIRTLTTLSYRAEAAGGIVSYLYADLPSANITGKKAYVINGRKAGEGAGAGTGVEAVTALLSGTIQWVNSDDNNQAVQV